MQTRHALARAPQQQSVRSSNACTQVEIRKLTHFSCRKSWRWRCYCTGACSAGWGAKRLGSTGLGRVLGPLRLQRRAPSLLHSAWTGELAHLLHLCLFRPLPRGASLTKRRSLFCQFRKNAVMWICELGLYSRDIGVTSRYFGQDSQYNVAAPVAGGARARRPHGDPVVGGEDPMCKSRPWSSAQVVMAVNYATTARVRSLNGAVTRNPR